MKLMCIIIACVLHCTYAAVSKPRDLKGLSRIQLVRFEEAAMEQCRVQNNISKSLMDDLDKQNVEKVSLPNTREFKCMLGCLSEEMTYIEDNKPQWQNMYEIQEIKFATEKLLKKALKIIDVCKTVVTEQDDDRCNLGYEMAKCYLTEAQRVRLWS
uniref:Secreted Odorant Binding Protein Family protein n=1 Tax=Pristhesancus plagipennis TaxID=1955184 RepID=A0A2K8JP19_PRIPG|nr:secreted Odorant Binding Protein Family protein [Pristhesancus plagipennis]